MATPILMPALSPTMTEGKLAKWLKKEGDSVSSGEVLAEIETDKATMELEAVDDGILGKIIVAEGTEGVAVNAPIAVVLADGEDSSAVDDAVAHAQPSNSAMEHETQASSAVGGAVAANPSPTSPSSAVPGLRSTWRTSHLAARPH